jgi:uncharacterized protein YbjT (DUF2867 family)
MAMKKFLLGTLKAIGGLILALVLFVLAYFFWLSGSSHDPDNVRAASSYVSPGGPVLVFGGTRGTGLEIVRKLRERGEAVTVAVRSTSNTAELEKLGVSTVIADALDAEQVTNAVTSGGYAAVVSTLGTTRGEQHKRPDYIGNRNVIDATQAAGVKRFVFITVIGAGDSSDAAPGFSKRFLAEVISLKTRAEDHLRASGLDYTIIRPGGLGDVPATGTAVLVEDPKAFSFIGREDLADLAVQALGDPSTVGKTYAAYDPSRKTMSKMYF